MTSRSKGVRKKPLSAGRGSDQFPLRLPEGMREQIKAFAEENGRSMNQEIIEILREQFPDPPSDSELMDQLKVALAWAGDLKSANKRHALSAHLMSFIEEMKRRTPTAERTAPLIEIERSTLDLVDHLCERLNADRSLGNSWERDEVADNLIKMSLMRIARGRENFKLINVRDHDFSNALVFEVGLKKNDTHG